MSHPTTISTPLGRTLSLRELTPEEETLSIHSPQGELEVELRLTRDGPVLRLSGERIELNAVDTVAVNCKRFEVRASESAVIHSQGTVELSAQGALSLHSKGEMSLRSEDELKAVANMIWLN